MKRCLLTLYYLIFNIDVMYYLAYGVFAIIGVVVHPFFFSFHLSEIFIRYPSLKNVIKALWQPKKALFLTLILLLILVYIFTIFGFRFLRVEYWGNCDKIINCFLYMIDFTFKVDGGIGG